MHVKILPVKVSSPPAPVGFITSRIARWPRWRSASSRAPARSPIPIAVARRRDAR